MRHTRTTEGSRVAHILCRTAPAMAILAGVALAPAKSEAIGLDIFLIADQSAPASGTGAPLNATTQTVYRLGGLNSNQTATTATLVDNFSFSIDTALTFSAQNNPSSGPGSSPGAQNVNVVNDENEIGAGTATYINSQISSWDNSGISGTTVDPSEQIDFGRNSSMTFNAVSTGFTDLILADLGGLNPFDLFLCADANCGTSSKIFGGFNRTVRNTLTSSGFFALADTGVETDQDQSWLFRFASPVLGFVKVQENDDRNVFTGERLQADFLGVGGTTTTPPPPPSAVPGPAGLPLLASGLGLLAWRLRRRKS